MLILNVISLVNYILYNEIILNNKDEIIEIYENNKEVNEYMYITNIRLMFYFKRLIEYN